MSGEGARELPADDVDLLPRLALGELLTDAEDRTEAGFEDARELPADQLVALGEVAATLGVADDDPVGEPDQHGRRDLAGVGALQLVVDVLRPDLDVGVRLGERVADRREGDEGRTDHPDDPVPPRPSRDRPGEVAGVGGGRVHLPIRGDDHVTHRAESCQSVVARMCRRPSVGLVGHGEPLEALERALDGGAMDLEPLGELGETRFGGLAAGLRHQPDGVRLRPEPAVGVERVDRIELPPGGAHRALEVGRLGVQDAIELTAQRPRHLTRLDLEQGAARADPSQERPDRLAVL